MELANQLDMDTEEMPSKHPGTLQCWKMLENWVEKSGDDAMICVLCDALYASVVSHGSD